MHVYKTTNLINGKIYIGQEKRNNPNYLGSGKILKIAIKKYGIENFKKEILKTCKDQNELNECEKNYINTENCFPPYGYNISKGNFGGDNFTNNPNKEEIRKKYKLSAHGWEFCNWSGKTHTEISKMKMSETKKGKVSKPSGWHHTNESKKKMSEKKMGISFDEKFGKEKSDIIKQKLRLSKLGKSYERPYMFGENNPSKKLEVRNKISEIKKENDKIKITCEYCKKDFTKPNYIKSHGEKCKKYKL